MKKQDKILSRYEILRQIDRIIIIGLSILSFVLVPTSVVYFVTIPLVTVLILKIEEVTARMIINEQKDKVLIHVAEAIKWASGMRPVLTEEQSREFDEACSCVKNHCRK